METLLHAQRKTNDENVTKTICSTLAKRIKTTKILLRHPMLTRSLDTPKRAAKQRENKKRNSE
jgi:hypothetical protein